jgi:hypothetical protein
MEKLLLQNQILIMESNLAIMNLNNFNGGLKENLKKQIVFSKEYLKKLS